MEFTDYQLRSLRRKIRPRVIINRMTGDIMTTLASILCADDEVISIFDGRGLTDVHVLRQHLSEVPEGYIIFSHLSEIPETGDSEKIKSLIYICVKGDWRNAKDVLFSEDCFNNLAQKKVGVLIISDHNEYKESHDFKKMVGVGVCSYTALGDNGEETIE